MKIELRKYGEILTSRPAGKDAALNMKAYIKPAPGESLELDFDGVLSVGPSWLDEVLTELRREFGADRVHCLPSENPSVIASLEILQQE